MYVCPTSIKILLTPLFIDKETHHFREPCAQLLSLADKDFPSFQESRGTAGRSFDQNFSVMSIIYFLFRVHL